MTPGIVLQHSAEFSHPTAWADLIQTLTIVGMRFATTEVELSAEFRQPSSKPQLSSGIMQVKLRDRLTHEPITAEVTAITDCHFADLNSTWPLAFRRRHQLGERDEDSLMWTPGAGSLDHLIHSSRFRSFALIAEGKIQGVLLLQVQTQLSRLEPQHSLVYVRYVATAPWNRRDKNRPGQIRGVGTLLMIYAVRKSLDAGCDGRLGLHSVRGSDDFYLLLGLENLGLDAARRGMNYFELSGSRATDFSEEL